MRELNMEELYTLGFEGQLTSKGRDKSFKAMQWDYWDEDPYLGGLYVHCEAPTSDRERYDDLKRIGDNGDCIEYGHLELREVNHFNKSRRYDRLVACTSFLSPLQMTMKKMKLEEGNMEKTKDLEPASAECGLDVEGEKEHFEKLKKEYAKLYDESRGKTVADYAQWDNEKGMAVVCVHTEKPDDCEEREHDLRSLASDILQIQNELANHEEIERYSEKRKEEEKIENHEN